MPADFSASKVLANEVCSSSKHSSYLTVLQGSLNAVGDPSKNTLLAGQIYDPAKILPGGAIDGARLAWSASLGRWTGGGTIGVGKRLMHTEVTAPVTVSATSSPGDTVVTAGAVTVDGSTPVFVDFFCFAAGNATTSLIFLLSDGVTVLGQLGQASGQTVTLPVRLGYRYTPGSGSHTYKVSAYQTAGSSSTLFAGTGGWAPIFLRVQRD